MRHAPPLWIRPSQWPIKAGDVKHANNHKHHRFVWPVNLRASDLCPFFTMNISVVYSCNCRRFQSVYPLKCHAWSDSVISTINFIFNSVWFWGLSVLGCRTALLNRLPNDVSIAGKSFVRTSHPRQQLGFYCPAVSFYGFTHWQQTRGKITHSLSEWRYQMM